jgi:lysyl-tRNA synthetase, class II
MDDRRAKLERLRAQGIDPFPHEFPGVVPTSSVVDDLEPGEETDRAYRVAGRMVARRDQGGAAFIDLVDRAGKLQLHAKKDVLGDGSFERLVSLDIGDLVGVDGTAFKTRRGQLSLMVTDWKLVAKSLRDFPKEHFGLEDVETRYRQREMDLAVNQEVRDLFILRSKVVSAVRRWLDERGFIEVETPILQPLYGGALARPFTTHYNALDQDFFLRIADELYLKRLIVGGLERVYEIGKDFRNEGLSPKHNPEFTMLEWYEAYADYGDAAARLEKVVGAAAQAAGYEGELDFAAPWRRVTFSEAIREATGVDIDANRDRESLVAAIRSAGVEMEGLDHLTWPQLVDDLLSKHVEPTLVQPTFVLDHPIEISPFAKAHRSKPGATERFEAYANGMEIANAFTELNDPDEQRARFEAQARYAAEGDDESQPYDEAFVQALEQGMPPTAGLGLGIDRLAMVLTGRDTIRDVVLFPALRGN